MSAAPRREIETPAYVLTQDEAGGSVTLRHKTDGTTRTVVPALMDELMSDAEFLADGGARYGRVPIDDWEID